MSVQARWEHHDDTEEYRSDATCIIRWEALHAVVSSYSNRDRDAYGRSTDFAQEILPLVHFFDKWGEKVQQRFGAAVWQKMMELAGSVTDCAAKLEEFFRDVPEDPSIHRLESSAFHPIRNRPAASNSGNWFGESIVVGGLRYIASNQPSFEVRDDSDSVVAHYDLPVEIIVRDIWLAGNEIYIPCRSYCWPTIFLRHKPGMGLAARSELGHAMDPLPTGFWRDIRIPM